ncbi:MAG: hypothetical protein Q8L26_08500 [Candidatus Omnitrophota bacterium]|nr:hypothetical protein [Candidatus Omnitrophota bacterium]
MVKLDIYHHADRYKDWKEEISKSGIDGLSNKNSEILTAYVFDMEQGVNIPRGAKKGARSYQRLNSLRYRIAFIMGMLEKRDAKDITKVDEKDLVCLFNDMRTGKIKTNVGEAYKSVADYVKIFKAFWHWHMTVNRKKGIQIPDITEDLDTSREKPKFVYITKDQLDSMLPYFSEDEQVVLLFIFDTLIRAPTELMNMKAKDIFVKEGEVYFNISQEISKTIGRTGNFLYCGEAVLKYIKRKGLESNDYIFSFSYPVFTDKLQKVAKQIFGDKLSHPRGELYSKMTLYDFRHSGACHLRQIAQKSGKISLDALRQRGGWTDFTMLNYYTEFLGLTGDIRKEDLLVEADKSRLEKEIDRLSQGEKKIWNQLNQLAAMFRRKSYEASKLIKPKDKISHPR